MDSRQRLRSAGRRNVGGGRRVARAVELPLGRATQLGVVRLLALELPCKNIPAQMEGGSPH